MLFFNKIAKIDSAGDPFPYLLASGGEAPRLPMASGSWGFCPQTSPNPNPIQKSWLRHWSSSIQRIAEAHRIATPTVDKGLYIKNVPTKSRKIDPLSSCSQNIRTGSTPSPLSVRTHHKFQNIRSFFAPKSADIHT